MKHKINIAFFVTFVVTIVIMKLSWWWILIGFLIFSGILIWGVFQIRFNYFLNSHHNNSTTKEKTIAITFDDGPTELTPKFLTLLASYNANSTFFCIGQQIEKHPETFQSIIDNGHEIGNHTYSHSNKTGFLSYRDMVSEIKKCDETIQNLGRITTKLYRPPFGVTNPNISRAIAKTNKIAIGWNIRSLDTVIDTEEKILNRILPKLKPGSIILLHDTSEKTYQVLVRLLLFLERGNYKMVTVSQLLNLKT